MFITSDNDRLVLPEESEQMYAKAGEPKKLVVLNGYSHYEVYEGPAFDEVMAHSLRLVLQAHPTKVGQGQVNERGNQWLPQAFRTGRCTEKQEAQRWH